MHILLVDNFLDHVKYASFVRALHHVILDELQCSMKVVPYTHFMPGFVEKYLDKFDAVVLSGSEAMLSKYSDQFAFKNTIEAVGLLHLPIIGICFGHQLLSLAHGESVVANMGSKIEGYHEVEVLVEDPLFDGLPRRIIVTQAHKEMIAHVPKEFSLLARSPETPIEAMRATKGIAYGVQFHPEVHDEEHPAGKLIFANFARVARQ